MLLKQKTLHAAIGLALSAVVLLTGCEKNTFVSSAIAAEHQMPPQEVVVVTAKAEPLHIATVLTGRTNSYTVAEVRPQVNGILQKRLFKEGQEVKAGDPLYQIDPAIYEAQLKSSEASLAQARAQLTQASADAKRSRELVKTNAVSKQSDDAAQAAMKTAQAAVKAAEAAVLTAKINLDYTKVRSPISGRVSRSEFTEGALLSAYQTTALTTVQQLDPIYVDVTQTADDMLRIQREIAAGTLKTDTQGAAEVELFSQTDRNTLKKANSLLRMYRLMKVLALCVCVLNLPILTVFCFQVCLSEPILLKACVRTGSLYTCSLSCVIRAAILTFMLLTRTIKLSVAILLPLKRKALSGLLIPVFRWVTV